MALDEVVPTESVTRGVALVQQNGSNATTTAPTDSGGFGISDLPQALQNPLVLTVLVLLVALLLGLIVGRVVERGLQAANVPATVEGTAFERTAQSLGTSTVAIVGRLTSWFVYISGVFAALNIARVPASEFQDWVVVFLPRLFIAAFVVITGFVVADKAELLVSERLKGVKLPEVNVVPSLVKYSVLYVVFLVALAQIGVQTLALIALLAAYAFALVVFGGLALKDFLSSGAAGIYLLLNQPYGIGDRIRVGDREGIVQGMDLIVTRIENDEEEYIVPNRLVLEHGVVRIRQ
jgi:small-conductance mechanosensitive channel